MIKIAGHWEIGYMTPIIEGYLWSLLLRDFGVKEWLMFPVSGINNNEQKRVELKEFHTLRDILKECGDLQRVYIEPRTNHYNPETIWLDEFEHPEDCVYIFGSAHFNPTIGNLRDGDKVVSIRTIHNRGVLWANQCVAIVLYDRLMKK